MRYRLLPALACAGMLCVAPSAYAATLTVDDDKADCPAAGFTSIQAAVNAAADGDTIVICQGKYVEGSGEPGTNAVTIQKNNLTLKGAGAGSVTISPKASGLNFGRILEAQPDLRNGIGDIIAIVGTPTKPLTAHISGVTVNGYDPDGRPVAVEAGIAFVDAKGSVKRSHVTNIVTSEGDNAYQLPGGYRGDQPGVGIVQTSRAMLAPVDGSRRLEIDRTRVDKYNRVGILIDGAQNDFSPFAASGAVNWGVITASQVIGRTLCVNFAGTGSCNAPGQVLTGPTFGQDGVRVTAGAYATIDSSLISQNLVNGELAPVRSTTTASGSNPVFTPNSTNNQNLSLAAGVRYAGARLTSYSTATGRVVDSWVKRSNIVDNSYGAINVTATGAANVGTPAPAANAGYGNLLKAEDNWWGVRNIGTLTVTPPPEINPTINPPTPENPVNGASAADEISGATTSNAVDYFPYRSGPQSDPTTGAWPVLTAPLNVVDNAPSAFALSAPNVAARGTTVTLSALGLSDDFAIKRVRFAEGATTLATATLPPYSTTVTIPATAACNSVRTYTAVAMDSIGQTTSATAPVTVLCSTGPSAGPTPEATASPTPEATSTPTPESPAPPTVVAASKPSIAFVAVPANGSGRVSYQADAPAGVKAVTLFLGNRSVCTLATATGSCVVKPTGKEVGGQSLRLHVTDAAGSTAEASLTVTVAKFTAKVNLKVTKKALAGGKVRRTVKAALKLPEGVDKADACKGTATLTIKRAGRTVINQQVRLSKSCTFSRSVTAARRGQAFSAGVKLNGNTVLDTASANRRFS